jgi:methyl coenzyme M reductase gamma subunit
VTRKSARGERLSANGKTVKGEPRFPEFTDSAFSSPAEPERRTKANDARRPKDPKDENVRLGNPLAEAELNEATLKKLDERS